jgi:hypothetical protein
MKCEVCQELGHWPRLDTCGDDMDCSCCRYTYITWLVGPVGFYEVDKS